MTFPAQHDAIKQRRIRSAPMMKFERVPSAAPLTTIDSAPQCRSANDCRKFVAGASVCHQFAALRILNHSSAEMIFTRNAFLFVEPHNRTLVGSAPSARC
jgi:hypothetical protein